MGQPSPPTFDFDGFRVRDSVTDPSGVDAAFDAGDTAADTDWTQTTDTFFRFRAVIKQTNAGLVNSDNATEFLLQYNNGAVGWITVGAVGGGTEDVDYASSSGFADGDNTAQLLGAGTNIAGDGMEVAGASDTITFTEETAGEETEMELALIVNAAQVTDADTIEFRFLWSAADEAPPATVFNAATQAPTITIDKPAGGGTLIKPKLMTGGMQDLSGGLRN